MIAAPTPAFRNTRLLPVVLIILFIPFLSSGCSNRTAVSHETASATQSTDAENTWSIKGIGEIAEDTSPDALQIQFGAQIALDEINTYGGINGVLLAFCSEDTSKTFRITAANNTVGFWSDPDGLLLCSITKPGNFSKSNGDGTTQQAPLHFYQKYKQMYGSDPDFYAVSAYCLIYYLKNQLEEYAATPDITATQLAEIFAETTDTITFEELLECTVTSDATQ